MSIEPERIIGTKLSSDNFEVSSHAWILYAIGIGFSSDNLDLRDLKFTYEKHKEFSTFPTFIGSHDVGSLYSQFNLPGLPLPYISNFLIGEQTVEIYKQIPVGSTIGSSIEFIDVADKKSGALVTARKDYWIAKENQTAINKEDIWVSVTMKVFYGWNGWIWL